MKGNLILCKCGYPREIGKACTACYAEETRPHLLIDTPANRAALEPVAVLLYNALGELQRQVERIGASSGNRERFAALAEAERVLTTARVRAEARSNASTFDLAAELAPGVVANALRRTGPRIPIVRRPYGVLEAKPKKG